MKIQKLYCLKNILLVSFFLKSYLTFSQQNLIKYVDPMIGTGGHGHTFPGATVPFGMVQLSPDSRIDGSWDGCSGYHYSDSVIFGFSHTHLSGTGVSDYGDILLFPFTGKFNSEKKYSSTFNHTNEIASPGYYSVFLNSEAIKAELTASERVGFHQYSYNSGIDSAGLIIDLRHRDKVTGAELFQIDDKHIAGFRRSSAWANDQLIFFFIEFSDAVKFDFVQSDSIILSGRKNNQTTFCGNIYASVKFKLPSDNRIKVKVALSSVSTEGARNNLLAEIPLWDFQLTRSNAENKWNKELNKIKVKGGTEENFKIFYTSLYHCMIAPNIYNDVDGHYRGRDFKIHKSQSDYYTVFSLWDTFRAWHPLMTIIDQKRTLDYIKTFLKQYEQGRMLPVWELSSNETECMIGYHSVSVITDAYLKGINNFNAEEALMAMRNSAEAKNRYGLGAYINHGYLDILDESESVSKTLEYSYDDWCISKFANAIGRKDVEKQYCKRSKHWQNLFDKNTKFIRPRKNGGWLKPFDPFEVNNNYTEANGWQYTFFVPHDVNEMINKMGGRNAFEEKLDQLFSSQNKTTGRDQADITGMIGQYAHGNEPSHHMAYLYNYTDHPWKTQMRITQILSEMYQAKPDGLIGNEDCGQMSAWFVMSAMGLYQICPGNNTFEITTPLFDDVWINLENGKTFHIHKENNSIENQYIQNSICNDIKVKKHLPFQTLIQGGELIHFMGKEMNDEKEELKGLIPEKERSIYNNCNSDFIISPVPEFLSSVFKTFVDVSLQSDSELKIFYSLNGKNPDTLSEKYTRPIKIDTTIILKAIAFDQFGNSSYITTTKFNKMPHPDWKINILSKYNSQYTAGGDEGIIDGIKGDNDWRKGGWQGYQGQDFESVIDFGNEILISSVGARFMQDTRSWILMPVNVIYEISEDNIHYQKVLSVSNLIADTVMTNTIEELGGKIEPVKARFLKVKAKNYGTLPSWHAGYGGEAFIFIDEIDIK